MAHDFNNILCIIMGNAEMTMSNCPDEEIKKVLQLIFNQTVRGQNLTRNLIAFAKDQEIKQEYFQINSKIDLVLNLLQKDLEGIKTIKSVQAHLPDLLADPGMIEHSLVNLIQNSIHSLSKAENPCISVEAYREDEDLYIMVEDNGCGIPEEYLEKIYEPSFTLKGSRDTNGLYAQHIHGTGYGMANVEKYIEQHKGSISVDSELHKGTRFLIKLPIIQKSLSEQEKEEFREETTYFGKYILLVEDEHDILDVQYKILTSEPFCHKVDIAGTSEAAADLIDKNTYDFISLDYILPGKINGIDLYRRIRLKNRDVPVLFISGNIEFLESLQELRKNDTKIDHLSKPCRNRDYINSINRLLHRQETNSPD